MDFIDQKVIVNLSPAEERKIGPLFDVAMAVAMLHSCRVLKKDIPEDTAFVGTLSLGGSVRSVKGILPAVLAAKQLGIKRLFVPNDWSFQIDKLDESLWEPVTLRWGGSGKVDFQKGGRMHGL